MTIAPKNMAKYVAQIVGCLLLVVILKGLFSPSKAIQTSSTKKADITNVKDAASSDTANETLKALSAQVQQVNDQNKQVIAENKQFRLETQQKITDMQQQVKNSLQQLNAQNHQLQQKAGDASKETDKNKSQAALYPIGQSSTGTGASNTSADSHLLWINDMQNSALPDTTTAANAAFLASTKQATPAPYPAAAANTVDSKQVNNPIPRYTIPANSVLADTTTMTGLIGRIPINGIVHDPYSFLLIVGPENLAANKTYMPDVAQVMVSGTASGDMAMHCVRGSITSLTFIFQDGTISTIDTSTKGDQGKELGYLASANGNPCINGTFYSNAPVFLGGNVLLGAAQGAAGAYAAEQTTSSSNVLGGSTSTVTGSPTKYVLGQAGVNAAGQAQSWWNQREQNSFDAVYVPPNTEIAIIIKNEIPIDYNPVGRKVAYDPMQSNFVKSALD